MAKKTNNVVPVQQVESLIYLLRGQKVMTDSDLAALYGVATKALNQAVRRNKNRFPEDFMFRLSVEEFDQFLRAQVVDSSAGNRSQIVTGSQKPKREIGFHAAIVKANGKRNPLLRRKKISNS